MNNLVHKLADSFADVHKRVIKLQQKSEVLNKIPRLRIGPWVKPSGIDRLIQALVQCANEENQKHVDPSSEPGNLGGEDLSNRPSIGPDFPKVEQPLNYSMSSQLQVEFSCKAEGEPTSVFSKIEHPSSIESKEEVSIKLEHIESPSEIKKEMIEAGATVLAPAHEVKRKGRRRAKFSLEKRKGRGKYRHYTAKTKRLAIDLLLEGSTVTYVGKELGIPTKNIKRWREQGIKRKSGAGRKRIDPEMEDQLYNWLIANFVPGAVVEQEQVRQHALLLSTKPEFMASKGWFAKFAKRFFLKDMFTLV